MNVKVLGAAVTAALLGLSTAAFGQAGASGSPAPAGGSTVHPTVPSTPKTDSATAGTGTQPSTAGASASDRRDLARCDTMTGMERERCLRDSHGAATGPGNPTQPDSVNRLPQRTDPTPPKPEDRSSPNTPRR
jgi:hypothetical protein